MERSRIHGLSRPLPSILWISVLGLFLELLLIRWVSTEIRIFAYLQNVVLVVCFLGLGAGLFTARQPIRPARTAWALFVLVALLAFPATREGLRRISSLLSVLGDVNIWYAHTAPGALDAAWKLFLGLAMTALVLALLVEAFVPIGRLLGRLLDDHPRPLLAYSFNIGGSLLGTWLFVALSHWQQPPATWFAVLGLLWLPFVLNVRPFPVARALPVLALLPLGWLPDHADGALETAWSPYQKLALFEEAGAPGPGGHRGLGEGRYVVEVNNVGYQLIADLRPGAAAPSGTAGRPDVGQYDLPFRLHPTARSVLVVGAGAGNDVAGALRAGVPEVTAVEIDPVILRLGERYHPERPYQAPGVRVITDDARSYFARARQRFDLIVFGLLDSHTTAAMTNTRLDHYVYTVESIRRSRDLLREGGLLVLVFEPPKAFVADRIAGTLRAVFGEPPAVIPIPGSELGWGGIAFVAGDLEAMESRLAADEDLRETIATWRETSRVRLPGTAAPATDDWPYLYLEKRGIPPLFILLAAVLGLLALALWSSLGKPEGMHPRSWNRGGWHFFFLGAAFLLLEVQNISKASIVLGSTWQVNAVIISGVLLMILLANLLVSRFPRVPTGPVFATLLGSVAALYFVDLAAFGSLPVAWKASVVGLLTTLPMLFAGVVFARSFARAARKDLALGANLLGALVGALLECLSFALGVRALLLIVGCLYLLAMLTEPGRRTRLAVLARGRGPERASAAAAVLLVVAALVARATGGGIGSTG